MNAYINSSGNYDYIGFSNIERLQITGTAANDTISTGGGNDIITGVNPNSATPGKGEIDILTGGAGSDKFILGDLNWIGYDDSNNTLAGTGDYAQINDFDADDFIQLRGSSSDYLLMVSGTNTNLYINKPGTEPDELIAILQDRTGLSLTGAYFNYVSNVTIPAITLEVSPSSVLEDGTANLVYTFTRTGATTSALTVNYGITGTAVTSDYSGATPGTGKTITFAAGASTATLTIDPTADTTVESDETVALTLATGTGYTVGTTTAVTGTITNDDNGTGVILSIPDNFTAVTGSTITVPININNATDLQSLDFSLNYNTTFLNLTAVTLGSLTSDFTITPNINDANGTATVSLFGTTAIPSGNGSIAQLNFTVANNATNGSNIPLDLVTASINEGSISTTLDDGSLNITPPTLQVTNFQTTPSGFTIQLSDTINTSVLNLYDGADVTNDLPDLTLVGATKGNIKGSLIWNGSTKTLNFVKTGGLLEADSYTLTLASRSDGFVKTNGDLLDGDANGTTGDNYNRTFSVAANSSRVLSLPDFSRGIGQAVDVPAGDSVFGLPIRIDNPSGAIGVDFAVEYDSNLLSLTEVNLGGNIPTGWQVTSNFNTPGQASFSVFGTTALTGNTLTDLVLLTGQVKNTATYGSSGLLKITSTSINEGVISSVGDSAVQLVALFGDATGNQAYSGLDASRIARVGVGIDSGFDPFPFTDPLIIGDITGNGAISGLDASRVAQRAVGISVPAIPNI